MNLSEAKIDQIGSVLEHNGFSDSGIDDYFLEHFGVRGMKWGQRRQARQSRVSRVASGKGSFGDKARFALTDTSTVAVLRRGGLQGAAAARSSQIERQRAAIESGRVRVRDMLGVYGSRLIITGRT